MTAHVILRTTAMFLVRVTDLNYWIKLLSCIIEANGGHIGLSHINLIGTIEVVEEVFTGLGYWWEWINIV